MTAAQFLLSGCVVAFGVVIAHAQGQQFAPPAPPPTTLYSASAELHAADTVSAKHSTLNTKHCSECGGYVACE